MLWEGTLTRVLTEQIPTFSHIKICHTSSNVLQGDYPILDAHLLIMPHRDLAFPCQVVCCQI